jgi:hypothetical protein
MSDDHCIFSVNIHGGLKNNVSGWSYSAADCELQKPALCEYLIKRNKVQEVSFFKE